MIRVTYTMNGTEGWLDFHCQADADAFLSWGDETGAFIDGELAERLQPRRQSPEPDARKRGGQVLSEEERRMIDQHVAEMGHY